MTLSLFSEKRDTGSNELADLISKWIGADTPEEPYPQTNSGPVIQEPAPVENRPIEPERSRISGGSVLKWLLFFLFVGYGILSYYRAPILTAMGSYLMLEHPLETADVIVCAPGAPLDQGLTAAELYQRGLAPRIFIPREPPPDGLKALEAHGGHYPTSNELFMATLKSLDIPDSACVVGQHAVATFRDEADELKTWVQNQGVGAMIIVTPPWKSRRTFRVFENILGEADVKIMMFPSRYSGFKTSTWWKSSAYADDVVFEYQKLAYEAVTGLW